MKRALFCWLLIFSILLSACQQTPDVHAPLTDFRQIEGVTREDIERVEAALAGRDSLVWAAVLSPEAYEDGGKAVGSVPLLAEHIGDLFNIDTRVEIGLFAECRAKVLDGTADFTIDLTNAEANRDTFIMTTGVTQRSTNVYSLLGWETLADLEKERPLRFAFVEGSNPACNVGRLVDAQSQITYVGGSAQAIEMLLSGEVDAVILDALAAVRFKPYSQIKIEPYDRIPFYSNSIATAQEELRPLIEVIQKYLDSADADNLAHLYLQGQAAYRRHHFWETLNEEERRWLKEHRNTPVEVSLFHKGYAATFYNAHTGRVEGLARNILQEMEMLTGLRFDFDNEASEAQIFINLMGDQTLTETYLQNPEPYATYQYVFLSRESTAEVTFAEIRTNRVGVLKGSEFERNYYDWFDSSENVTAYTSDGAAFAALDRGEIDLLLTSRNTLHYVTHFLENHSVKVNYALDAYDHKHFYFSKDEPILQSIISKAQGEIDVDALSSDLSNQIYRYRGQALSQSMRVIVPILILTFVLAVMLFAQFRRNKRLSDNFMNLINKLNAGILITDLKTDEIIFVNEKMNEAYGVTYDPSGQPCWAAYHGRTDRCPFCPIDKLEVDPTTPLEWE